MLYTYLKQIKHILQKNALNIFISDVNDIELYNKLQLFKHKIYVYAHHDFEQVTIRYKYSATPIYKNQLQNIKFDITLNLTEEQLFFCLNNVNTQYIFYNSNISQQLYFQIPYVYIQAGLLKFSAQPKQRKVIQKKNENQLDINKLINDENLKYNAVLSDFPILIRSYNKLSYLYTMINSIYSTDLYNGQITIVDNNSTDKMLNEFFYSFNKKLIAQKLSEQEIENTNIKQLPSHILGIKQKILVHQYSHHVNDCKELLNTIKYGFQTYQNAPFIILLKDNLIFNKEWLTELIKIYDKHKDDAGIITCYNNLNENIQIIESYSIQTACILITKKFYDFLNMNDYFQKDFFNDCDINVDDFKNISNDILRNMLEEYGTYEQLHLSWYCKDAGLKAYTTGKNYIDYISNSKNFSLSIEYDENTLKNLRRFMDTPESVLIFSNEQIDETKIKNITLYKTDLLVFLNESTAVKYFKSHKNKIILHEWNNEKYQGFNNENLDCKKYAINGPNSIITEEIKNQIKQIYSYQNQVPSFEFLVFSFIKNTYKNTKIEFINFENYFHSTYKYEYELKLIEQNENIKFINLYKNPKDFDWRANFDHIYYLNNTLISHEIDNLNEVRKTGINGIKAFSFKHIFNNAYTQILFKNLKQNNKTICKNIEQFVVALEYYKCIKEASVLKFQKILIINDDVIFVKKLEQLNKLILHTPNITNIKIYDNDLLNENTFKYCMLDKYAIQKLLILFEQNIQQIQNYFSILKANNILNVDY